MTENWDKTIQHETKQDKTVQHETKPDKTIQHETKPDKTVQHETKQDKTVQHVTIETLSWNNRNLFHEAIEGSSSTWTKRNIFMKQAEIENRGRLCRRSWTKHVKKRARMKHGRDKKQRWRSRTSNKKVTS